MFVQNPDKCSRVVPQLCPFRLDYTENKIKVAVFLCKRGVTGRFVRISEGVHLKNTPMLLCEVEVRGGSISGTLQLTKRSVYYYDYYYYYHYYYYYYYHYYYYYYHYYYYYYHYYYYYYYHYYYYYYYYHYYY